MKRIVISSLLLISSFAQAAESCFKNPLTGRRQCITIPDAPPPAKECAVLYENSSFGGAAWGIQAETDAADISGAMIERRKWRGTLRGYTGDDRSWNDAVSSVRANPGCVLTMWTDVSFTGEAKIFDGVSEAQVPLNDAFTSFKCTCSETAITGSDGGPVYYRSVLP